MPINTQDIFPFFPVLSYPSASAERVSCSAGSGWCSRWKCLIFGERNPVIHSFAAAESVCGMGAVSELPGWVLLPFDVVHVPWCSVN